MELQSLEKQKLVEMRNLVKNVFVLPLVALLFAACGGGSDIGGGSNGNGDGGNNSGDSSKPAVSKTDVKGIIEKGPFVQGSKVTLYDLNDQLVQTGKSYTTNTRSDLGDFEFDSAIELSSRYAEFETSGFFYNECDSSLSKAQITLKALADVSANSKVNVNLLTHLEYARVKHLVKGGMAFAEAKKQAERELLKVFAIKDDISSPENISIADGNKNASVLLAISSVMLYGKSEAEFSEFISHFSTDFEANGIIDEANISKSIKEGQKNQKPDRIAHAMKRYYSEKGRKAEVNDFSAYIDFNGDGIIDDKDEYVPYVLISSDNSYWPPIHELQNMVNYVFRQAMEYIKLQLELEAFRFGSERGRMITADSGWLLDAWFEGYRIINHANQVLLRLENIRDFNTTPYKDQTKALLAFVYYNMAMSWGNILLIEEYVEDVFNTHLVQSDANTIYAYCEDLMKGIAPTATEKGMVNRDFVTALSAEIALAKGNTAEAKKLLDKLPDTDIFSFGDENNVVPVYTAEYIRMLKKEASAEAWAKRGAVYGTWAALKRSGKATTILKIKEYELLLPIPQNALYTDPRMKQNPGWGK
uniref:RagB/SusD family nutrient uptake outer membrane protein n=1 Tax=Prevotella sp. GTC17254 TaxID=3236794 RepID=A0AB33J110_9BACT